LTDENGRYSIVLPAAAVRVRAVRIGFRPGVATIRRVGSDDLTIDLTMERAPVQLQTVRVAAVDNELAESSWLMMDVDPGLIFSVPAEQMWETAIRRLGADPSALQQSSGVH
jgi:hypothetical protein